MVNHSWLSSDTNDAKELIIKKKPANANKAEGDKLLALRELRKRRITSSINQYLW